MASVGIAIALSVATAALTSALTPKPEPQRGLDDLSVLKSELGVPIPKVYGRAKVTGNVIWATDIKEVKKSSGGKGGGSQSKYVYLGTFAVLLCEGEIENIGRIWLNNKLVSDLTSDDLATVRASTKFESKHIGRYYGTANQPVDETIAAIEGESNTPAFRHCCYLVFSDVPLAEYGNAIPKVEAEIINTSASPTLHRVLEDVCSRSGLISSEYNASALAGRTIRGAILKQDGQSIREFIEQLQRCYHFISKEVKGVVKFEPIGQQVTITVPYEALGTKEDTEDERELYTEIREQVIDLPSQVQMEYLNADNCYKRGIQTAYKAIATHVNEMNFSSSIVLTDSEAITAATKNLEYYWNQRRRYEGLRLPPEFIDLEPGQLLELPIRNSIVTCQIEKLNIGTNLIVEVDAVTYSTRVNNISVQIESEYRADIVPFYGGQPEAIVLDINSIRDTDNDLGLYATPKPDPNTSGWNGGTLYAEPEGGNYTSIGTLLEVAPQGILTQDLPPADYTVVDRVNKLKVILSEGQLESLPDLDFYNLTQVAYINGELIGFQNAELIATDTYELTGLIRGARGTESFIANHATGSSFYLLSDFTDIPGESSGLESNYSFKAVPSGFAVTEIVPQTELTIEGNRLKPYAPCNPYLVKKANSDLTLYWYRRTRKQGQWLQSSETVPIAEDSEKYEFELYSGSTRVLLTTVSAPQITLTVADQISYLGSSKNSLTFKIYQMSTLVGRGYPLERDNLKFNRLTD